MITDREKKEIREIQSDTIRAIVACLKKDIKRFGVEKQVEICFNFAIDKILNYENEDLDNYREWKLN